ncbi:MAG: Rne/Rng family ribonuclease [Clostridia bacterium]|nr:Rne/Rng family ribonuclease [Clostridia bacterium]
MKNMIETAVDKTILVSVDPYITRVMLLENGVPVEFSMEKREEGRLVGNIYKGRVQNVLPGMFAAFIDINAEKNAFLYAGDVKEGSPLLEGEQIDGKLTPSMVCSIIKPGSDIMVQVVKEPIGTKGARVSTQISLPGRMLVFMPTVDFTGVSKRITNEAERKRLKALVSGLLPEGTGVIVRTAAEGVDDDMIRQELNSLIDEWKHIERRFRTGRSASLIHKEDSLIFRTVRDAFGADVRELAVNDREAFELIKSLVDEPLRGRITLREGPDLFESCGAEQAIDEALARRVWLKSGAYIVIDRTEALTSIDVNTGKYVGKVSLDRTIVDTNREAAVEIARQLRLRDIGGIVIIDFIDMADELDRKAVLDTLTEALRRDSTKSVVLGMTRLGLVEVTRKKLGPGISHEIQSACPYCGGTGRVLSAETVALRLRAELLRRIVALPEGAGVLIKANPAVIELLGRHSEEEYSITPELGRRIIRTEADPMLHIEEFSIKNI